MTEQVSKFPFLLVEHEDSLKKALDSLKSKKILAIDTEFLRDKTYYSRLALVQICDGEFSYLFDPLKVDLAPLAQLFESEDHLFIFHSADQDLDVMISHFGVLPARTFDTQVAAAFLGQPHQIGLSALTELYLGVFLNKNENYKRWLDRPFTENQLRYAVDDVAYLHEIYYSMVDKLKKAGFYDEFLEECRDLNTRQRAVKKIFNKHNTRSRSKRDKNILYKMIEWREKEAIEKDKPRTWILKDPQILSLLKDNNPASWAQRDTLSPRQLEKYTEILLGIIHSSEHLDSTPPEKNQAKSKKISELALIYKKKLDESCLILSFSPEWICSQKKLFKIAKMNYSLYPKNQFEGFGGWKGRRFDSVLRNSHRHFFKTQKNLIQKN